MAIQPVIGTPGVSAPKLAVHREVFLHPDKVSYRSSPRLLHKLSLDWESTLSPETLKGGTVLALRKISSTDSKSYWMPWVCSSNHLSYNSGSTNFILLPISFASYASQLFPAGSRFTRVTYNANGELDFTHIASTANATTTTISGNDYVAIPVSSITNTWADNSILLYHGVGVGPSSAGDSVFLGVEAVSVVPGNTLVTSQKHTQLHHYPWSGIVLGNSLYPRSTISGQAAQRNKVLKAFLKECSSRGFTGLLVDEVN